MLTPRSGVSVDGDEVDGVGDGEVDDVGDGEVDGVGDGWWRQHECPVC